MKKFCDGGYSGVDFRRPGVQALIEAAKSGNINMVIVKDFSRFGRDYLEVGRFLEYIFPILQIRFVSVNDSYDSDDKFGATGGMSVALKNLVYGMYSADLSKKVRTARDTRVRNGEFVGQFAPYGYRKDPEDKHKLLVDEASAWVVQKIFGMATDGISYVEIARRLNEERIPSRVVYHKLIGDTYGDRQPHVKVKRWCASSVRDISEYKDKKEIKNMKGIKLFQKWLEHHTEGIDVSLEIAPLFVLYDLRLVSAHLYPDADREKLLSYCCERIGLSSDERNYRKIAEVIVSETC